MANAIANRAHLSFVQESAFGSTLSATALKQLRIVSESLALAKNIVLSGQMDQATRNRVAVIEASKSAGGSIDCELSFTDFVPLLQAALGVTIANPAQAGATYKNGNVLQTFYFEKLFADVSRYIGVYGCAINELELRFSANQPVTATFGIMAAKTGSLAATRGQSYTAPSTDAVMRSGVDVAHVKVDGSAIACAVRAMTLKIANGLKPTEQLTSDIPAGFQFGDFQVSGSFEAYFPDAAVYDLVEGSTSKSMEIKVANEAGSFAFNMPAVRFTGGTPAIPGQGQDVMLSIPFLAHQAPSGDNTLNVVIDPVGP
jgi:hypothetical protein